MNGIVQLLAKSIWASLRQTAAARQSAIAMAMSLYLAATALSQESETKNADIWESIHAAIRQPRDTVVRKDGSQDEPPLALTPEEVRDPANDILRVDRLEAKLLS